MEPGKEKKLVYVSEDVVREALRVSSKKGLFLSRFVEESLKQAVKLEDLGYRIEDVAETFESVWSLRALGGVFVPQEVFECMTEDSCRSREELLNKWFESGVTYGKYLRDRFNNPLQKLKRFLESVRWDLSEVEFRQENNRVRVRCVTSAHTTKTTEPLARFLEGLMRGLGYSTLKIECFKGIIIAEFTT